LRKRLRDKLATSSNEATPKIYNSFDIVGDIAIIKVPSGNEANAEAIAQQIMATHKKLKSVFTQTSAVKGAFRVRELKLLAGENQTVTQHKEWGCSFNVDVEKCYLSPRLSYEHQRIARLVKPGETLVNMFAGVGCFSIVAAKALASIKVYSVDVNPVAYQFMLENIRLNGVEDKVTAILGDSKDIVETQLRGTADRVLMPLPELALQYLPTALLALKKGRGWIHYYDFQHAKDHKAPIEQTKQIVAQKLTVLGVTYTFGTARIIRPTGPNWYQTVLDIEVT
jgi:tRNA (guanine37-N1)-methyltransferase